MQHHGPYATILGMTAPHAPAEPAMAQAVADAKGAPGYQAKCSGAVR